MSNIELITDENGRQSFRIAGANGEELGRMEIGVKEQLMTVYHTEVSPRAEGKGLAKELLTHMTEYARSEKLKVNPLCQFVHLQFKRRPEEFSDLWVEKN
jgi:uncharacterized protein